MADESTVKIALMGPFGSGNLGDAATQDAMIANLRRRFPKAEIFGISVYPEDTERRHGITSFPMHRSVRKRDAQHGQEAEPSPGPRPQPAAHRLKAALRRLGPLYALLRLAARVAGIAALAIEELKFMIASHRTIRGMDFLVCSGGGQLDDHWGGPWSQPFSLFRWALVARLAGVKFGFVSVGVGHLDSPISRFLVRRALAWACYRSFRDPQSRERVARMGLEPPGDIFPDLAYSLPRPHRKPTHIPGGEAAIGTVGVNVIPYCAARGWPDSAPETYRTYLKTVADAIEWLAGRGLQVIIFPTAEAMDMLAIRDLETQFLETLPANLRAKVSVDPVKGVDNLLRLLEGCDLVITSRFHGVLLSYVVGTPAIGLSYHWKIDELMKECGQDAFCFDIERATTSDILAAYGSLTTDGDRARGAIRQRVLASADRLSEQYERLFDRVAKAAERRRLRA